MEEIFVAGCLANNPLNRQLNIPQGETSPILVTLGDLFAARISSGGNVRYFVDEGWGCVFVAYLLFQNIR
jgi:hypothetical protein